MNLQPPRLSVAGTRQIIRFNWPTFGLAAAALTGGLAVASISSLPRVMRLAGMGVGAIAGYGLVGSIAASWWVYDHSALSTWGWLDRLLDEPPTRWANITTGFDDTTVALRSSAPDTDGRSIDVFDDGVMVEPSIRRARALRPPGADAIRGRPGSLPIDDASLDAVFLLFAAHEVREDRLRAALFAECRRVLGPGGRLVVVEHLRDVPNGLVFGLGALHFFGRAEWLAAGRAADLRLVAEESMTPFVRGFAFARS